MLTMRFFHLPSVVDDEMGANWGWALSCLWTAIQHVVLDPGICIISDQHRAIISSIEQWPYDYVPVYHRYCIKHVASNFNTQFKNPFLKSLKQNTLLKLANLINYWIALRKLNSSSVRILVQRKRSRTHI